MRMIERMMVNAIKNGKDFHLDNTQVRHDNGVACVYLFGNQIAVIGRDHVLVRSDFGKVWRTATTKSRINSIIWEFGCRKSISQMRNRWYIWDWDDKKTNAWEGEHTFPRKEKSNG